MVIVFVVYYTLPRSTYSFTPHFIHFLHSKVSNPLATYTFFLFMTNITDKLTKIDSLLNISPEEWEIRRDTLIKLKVCFEI